MRADRLFAVLMSFPLLCAAPLVAAQDTAPPPVVVEAALPFAPLPAYPTAQQYWGVHEAAGYRVEVPANWNGSLVMYAHGYRGDGPLLTVSNPAIRSYLLANGFAWAASSYYRNHYDARAGVISTNALARHFDTITGLKPERYFIHGHSMGGHVTLAAIEQFPNRTCPKGKLGHFCREAVDFLGTLAGGVKYSGAVPMCGVNADTRLFDYFSDFNLVAAKLANVEVPRPAPDYATTYLPLIVASHFTTFPTVNTPLGDKLEAATIELTGGPRPIVGLSYPGFMSLLFGFGGGDGSIANVTNGRSVVSNIGRIYQLDHDPKLSLEEYRFNKEILRVRADPQGNPSKLIGLEVIPKTTGNLHVPTVSMHTLGDLFVPFSMQQIYAERTKLWGQSGMFVSRAIRAAQHCEFSVPEQEQAFADMLRWVDQGVKPKGDNILNRKAVQAESFGCQFTTPLRAYDNPAACVAN
jgi:pimeloyl-ACP methyl ester carboxylesterase